MAAGGGGWGRPSARDPEARISDLENGFVTPRERLAGHAKTCPHALISHTLYSRRTEASAR
jgi:hypothetical protein